MNVVAMLLVGSTAFIDTPAGDDDGGDRDAMAIQTERDPRIGVLFIVLSCTVQGAQYVFGTWCVRSCVRAPMFMCMFVYVCVCVR